MLFLIAAIVTACSVDPLAKYNGLIGSYQNARMAAANSQACFALVGSQLNLQISVYNSYLVADVAKTKAYRDALRTAQTQIDNAKQGYVGPDGQPVAPDKLDLGQLAAQHSTPADAMGGFTLMVNAFTEAPLAPVDPSALHGTQQIIQQQFNQAFACVTDWNLAVNSYNTERNQVSGDIVGQIAQKLGVKDLPESLPYYTPPTGSASPFNATAPTPALP